jgi:uncharacterized secreted protein with C-terminal beta-propeller domain
MGQGRGIKEVGYIDCAGGGQVVVKGNIAYIGNMSAPDGTVIYDVSDPKRPRELSRMGMIPGTHSHKVRVENDLMVINREVNPYQLGAPSDFKGGLGIYDVSKPQKPKLLANWETHGMGVHRSTSTGATPTYLRPSKAIYLP